MPRKEEIDAAVAAHNTAAHQQLLLPPSAGRLLAVMFRQSSVCQRSVDDLATEGFDRKTVLRLLPALIEAGFLSKERPSDLANRSNIYRLHLPPRGQP